MAAAERKTGWEYFLQGGYGDGLPDGLGDAQQALRQPLQPLSQPFGQLQQPLAQAKAQLVGANNSAQPESNGVYAVPDTQQQQMALLPNDANVQQHQQTAGSPADKQIAVQQAVSLTASEELPMQPQHAAQPANGFPAPSGSAQHAQHASQLDMAPELSQGTSQPQPPSAPLQPASVIPYSPAASSMPRSSTLLASLVPAVQHRPLSAGAAPGPAPGQNVAQGFSNSPALSSREGTPTVRPPPRWVHEDKLPLWLVKAFEEKRRRDVSMVAARAAQQAQRDANAANRGVLFNEKYLKAFLCCALLLACH